MNISLLIIVIVLFCICIALTIKVYFIKNSINEIVSDFKYILKSDTNNEISISSEDKSIKRLTKGLNNELKSFRIQRLQYENGNQELKRLITDISHDLRTPLTAINCYTETLEDEELNDTQQECVKIIHSKTKELISLTEQLRELSAGIDIERTAKKEKCCINDILEETIISYYSTFKEKNIKPNIDICKNKIYRNVDKEMIVRVFENLISNIIKYSDGNCNIKLEESGKIVFSNKSSKLDTITIKKIFDRYYTLESAKRYSGLGLTIAKQLIEINGGTIKAEYLKNELFINIIL